MSSKKGKAGKGDKSSVETGDGLRGNFLTDFPVVCQQIGLPPLSITVLNNRIEEQSPVKPVKPGLLAVEDESGILQCLYIRNLLLEERLLQAIATALDTTPLQSIKLWNVGINNETIQKLISIIKSSSTRKLYLEGNELFADLVLPLFQCSSLRELCLRCCCLGDAFCEVIGQTLASNTSLISLDLSSNQITDEGVRYLAKALRWNRQLISLRLSDNKIGDRGVQLLCQVMVKFPLNKQEENIRNSLLTTTINTTNIDTTVSSSGRSSSGASVDRSGRSRSKKKEEGSGKGGTTSGKGGKTKSGGSSGGGGKKGGRGDSIEESTQQSQSELIAEKETGHPLLDLVTENGDQLWMAGNTTLAHLTLSCNNISVVGVASLLNLLHHQQEECSLLQMTSDPTATKKLTTGLLRVTLENNPIPQDCTELQEVVSLMRSRDPLAPPTTEHEENGTQS